MRKGLAIGIGGVTVAFFGGSIYGLYRLITLFVDYGPAASELPQAVVAYRGTGLPFVAFDIALPRPSPAEDATPAIRSALKALPKGKAKAALASAMRDFGSGSDPVVADYARSLALIASAVDRPRVDFRREWDLGPNVLFPEYAGMKDLARAATVRAVHEAQRGDDVKALRDLGLAQRIGLWAGEEPTIISALNRIAIETIALDGAELCLAAAKGRPERIARYVAWLRVAPPKSDLGKALRGEAWMGVASGRNLDHFRTDHPDVRLLRHDGLPDGTMQRAMMARILQAWTEAADATDRFRLPPIELGKRFDAVGAKYETKRGMSQTLVAILFPSVGTMSRAFVNLDAKRAVALGFAEAMDVQARTGRWPSTMSPIDPFTGKPLRLRSDEKGFRVWSVGRDGLDDGGLSRREATKIRDLPEGQPLRFDEVAAYPPMRS